MRKLYILMLLPFLAFMAACSAVEEEVLPDNEIVDAQGVTITLEWTTGGSTSQSQTDVDLDLYLYKDNAQVDASERVYSFEDVDIQAIYSDGVYDVDVEFYRGTTGASFTLYVTGKESQRTVTYTGTFDASEAGNTTWPDFIKIEKSGTTYTISK